MRSGSFSRNTSISSAGVQFFIGQRELLEEYSPPTMLRDKLNVAKKFATFVQQSFVLHWFSSLLS